MTERAQIRERWSQSQTLFVDGIVHANGDVTLLRCHTLRHGHGHRCFAAAYADTSASSVLKYHPDAWVHVCALERLALPEGGLLLCGEGAMGNDGFVAYEAANELAWVLVCTASNPFTDLQFLNGAVVVSDGFEGTWHIPLDAPERFTIEHAEAPGNF